MTSDPEIAGQEAAFERLRLTLADSRVPHAFLFHGPRGVGKFTVAKRFAAALLCTAPREGLPCGRCRSCAASASGSHPDLDFLAPPEGSRTIPIDAVRELVRRASLTPVCGGRRVFLIDNAHDLSEEAANSLLKVLEEPPDPVVLLLVTWRPESLLPTVLSRTQAVAFKPLPAGVCAALLRDRHGLPAEEAAELAELGAGSPGRALELRDCPAFRWRDKIFGEILETRRGSFFEGGARLAELAKASARGDSLEALREGLRTVFSLAAAFLRDVEAARRSPGSKGILGQAAAPALARALEIGAGAWATAALARLSQARESLDRYVNPALVAAWWLSKAALAKEA